MTTKQGWTFALTIIVLLLAGAGARQAAGRETYNVGLVRFEALAIDDGVLLEWDVESEVDTSGYKIKRGENAADMYLQDAQGNDLIINATGGPTQAASYSHLDENVSNGETYVYALVELTRSQGEELVESLTITVDIVPTNTPVTFAGGTNGPVGGTQGATPTATATRQATATSPSNAGPTAAAPPTVSAPTPLPTATAETGQAVAFAQEEPSAPEANANPGQPYPADSAVIVEEPAVVLDEEIELDVAIPEESSVDAYPAPEQPIEEATQGQMIAPQVDEAARTLVNDAPTTIRGLTTPSPKLNPEASTVAAAEQQPESPASSRFILWFAFIVALGVFVASVVGAILLYTRRRSSG